MVGLDYILAPFLSFIGIDDCYIHIENLMERILKNALKY